MAKLILKRLWACRKTDWEVNERMCVCVVCVWCVCVCVVCVCGVCVCGVCVCGVCTILLIGHCSSFVTCI